MSNWLKVRRDLDEDDNIEYDGMQYAYGEEGCDDIRRWIDQSHDNNEYVEFTHKLTNEIQDD